MKKKRVKIKKSGNGVMIALMLPPEIAQAICIPGGEPLESLHLTLAYIKGIADDEEKKILLQGAISPIADVIAPLLGTIGGIGRFAASESSDGMDVFYASYNSPGLEKLRAAIMKALDDIGLAPVGGHGFTPHITLSYLPPSAPMVQKVLTTPPFAMNKLVLASKKGDRVEFEMNGSIVLKAQPGSSSVHVPSTDWKKVAKKLLTSQGRNDLSDKSFALPKERKYPIHDVIHARNALSRVSQSGTAAEKKKVQEAVYARYPSLDPVKKDSTEEQPGDDAESSPLRLFDMQALVSGMDWELVNCTDDPSIAKEVALSHLEDDPDYYEKLMAGDDYDEDVPLGMNLDLGSGSEREPGYLGLDLFPHDHGTITHDLNLGIPFADQSAKNVRMVNSLHHMEDVDKEDLLGEIGRVLMPGGQFSYEGPEELYNYPDSLAMVDWQSNEEKVEKDGTAQYRQTFERVAQPDAATANDADPRTGVDQFDTLPGEDSLLAVDALGYYWDDAPTSSRGNLEHGYLSQGASVDKGGPGSGPHAQGRSVNHQDKLKEAKEKYQNAKQQEDHARQSYSQSRGSDQAKNTLRAAMSMRQARQDEVRYHERALEHNYGHKAPVFHSKDGKVGSIAIAKADKQKQIVYGVILTPDEIDAQEDFMNADDIEAAAHKYLEKSRVIGSRHAKPTDAFPVESYIAPQDLQFDGGPYGPQLVKKGAWVLGVKVPDPAEWEKVATGEYQGFSVGGFGLRE